MSAIVSAREAVWCKVPLCSIKWTLQKVKGLLLLSAAYVCVCVLSHSTSVRFSCSNPIPDRDVPRALLLLLLALFFREVTFLCFDCRRSRRARVCFPSVPVRHGHKRSLASFTHCHVHSNFCPPMQRSRCYCLSHRPNV